jgi:hypothetical protein
MNALFVLLKVFRIEAIEREKPRTPNDVQS